MIAQRVLKHVTWRRELLPTRTVPGTVDGLMIDSFIRNLFFNSRRDFSFIRCFIQSLSTVRYGTFTSTLH